MNGPVPAVRRERGILLATAAAASAACWIWTARLAARMGEHHHLHREDLGAAFVMWAVMMAGMMIPPEIPTLLRVARARREQRSGSPFQAAAVFLSGYLFPWVVFSLAAAWLQMRLQMLRVLDHDMSVKTGALAAALLFAAGALQLSPLKRACLALCRGEGVATNPRAGGAFTSGVRSSAISIASCGILMLVLFVTGVMSLPGMVILTALLVLEKVVPRGERVSTATGALLLLWGGWALMAA